MGKIKKMLLCIGIVIFLLPEVGIGIQIKEVNLPDILPNGQEKLILNGAGVRKKLFLDLYVAGLYLMERTSSADKILNSDIPVGIRLHIISKLISSKNMEKATREGFEKVLGEDIVKLQDKIDEFISVFKSEPIKKNDIFDLIYFPKEGVKCFKNGKLLKVIPGEEFKKALFGIWLSERCVQEDLRNSLLGK